MTLGVLPMALVEAISGPCLTLRNHDVDVTLKLTHTSDDNGNSLDFIPMNCSGWVTQVSVCSHSTMGLHGSIGTPWPHGLAMGPKVLVVRAFRGRVWL